MLFYIAFFGALAFALVVIWAFAWSNDWDVETIPGKIAVTLFGIPMVTVVVLAGITLVFLLPTGLLLGTTEHDAERIELQQINLGNNVNGRFFLGSGYVDNDLVYSYYAKNDDGSFYASRVWAEDAVIVPTDTETPHIQTISKDFPSWLFPEDAPLLGNMREWDERYVIYVPAGSIKQMVEIDLPED